MGHGRIARGVVTSALVCALGAGAASARSLSFEDRVEAQKAIERVYWAHRLWPAGNPGPKPSFERVVPEAAIRAKVRSYLETSSALEARSRPITEAELRAEVDRMTSRSQAPELLRELFDALGNDPDVIAEALARPRLASRLAASAGAGEAPHESAFGAEAESAAAGTIHELDDTKRTRIVGVAVSGDLPPETTGCLADTWSSAAGSPPVGRTFHTAVWTGTEMIVWGGGTPSGRTNTGGRYDPATDSWTPTSTGTNVPAGRSRHVAVWTGTEMIVWGGFTTAEANTGGRYNVATDTWTPTSTGPGDPQARENATAVWTGTEMIVWGGLVVPSPRTVVNTGGRYNPSTDTWTPTSSGPKVPSPRDAHSAVWTGTEMIVWGGEPTLTTSMNTGGRYDPSNDSWIPTSTGGNVPSPRVLHTAVWTGREMIVWGGREAFSISNSAGPTLGLGTGGRYDPATDTWASTSTAAGAASGRYQHTALFTGSEMIVWGGRNPAVLNSGGRYDPVADTWSPTSMGADAPSARDLHTAVWTGARMIVWGGENGLTFTANASLYCGCPEGRIVHRDLDGDGFGDPGAPSASCDGSIPAGYVADATDCQDDDPAVHPGTIETCNGIDDDCDGAIDDGIPVPSGPLALTETVFGALAQLSWNAVPGATGYDVVRGSLADLAASRGNFTTSTRECLANDLDGTALSDVQWPVPAGGIWHLVRAVSVCGGNGSYDEGGPGQSGSRDPEIPASGPGAPEPRVSVCAPATPLGLRMRSCWVGSSGAGRPTTRRSRTA